MHKAEHLRNVALLCADTSSHTPIDLHKFVCHFKESIMNLIHVDVPWDDDSSKVQFESVVNHESTLWMLHQCWDMTFTETMDFFQDAAGKGMQKDNDCGRMLQR